jgi:hypothetical protein
MLKLFSIIYLLTASFTSFGQSIKKHFVYFNITECSLRNPKIGVELFKSNKRNKSTIFEFSYRIQDRSVGTFLTARLSGTSIEQARPKDAVSIFVYNGPTIRIASAQYINLYKVHTFKYVNFGIIMKYNWYDNLTVFYMDNTRYSSKGYIQHYRMQNEKMWSLGGNIEFGIKKKLDFLCIDFFIGGILDYKNRNFTIDAEVFARHFDHGSPIISNNYEKRYEQNASVNIYPSIGMRIGFIK